MSDAPGHPQTPLTASQRLAAALGQQAPTPLSETAARDFERRQDIVDAQIEQLYRQSRAA